MGENCETVKELQWFVHREHLLDNTLSGLIGPFDNWSQANEWDEEHY